MNGDVPPVNDVQAEHEVPGRAAGDLLILSALTLLTGAATGLVAAAFRMALQRADDMRDRIIDAAHDHAFAGFIAVLLVTAAAAAIAAFLDRRFSPHASGSGIPPVEAVLNGQAAPAGPLSRRRRRHWHEIRARQHRKTPENS